MGLMGFLIVLTAFWSLVYIAYRYKKQWFEQRSIEVQVPLIVWRITRRLQWLENVKGGKTARRIGEVFVILTVVSAGLYYWFIGGIAYKRIIGASSQNGVVLLIPGLTIWGEALLYFLLAASIAIVLHELAHAVMAGMEGVKLSSAGLALLLVFPAAFVEPEEESLNSAPLHSKLKILAAGSAANLILGALFLGLLFYTVAAPAGIIVTSVEQGSPAASAGITPGMRIIAVNGTRIHRITDLHSFINASGTTTLIMTIIMKGEARNITVFKPANRSIIGIYFKPAGSLLGRLSIRSYEALLNFVDWSYMINFSLALVNAAPLFITDGAKMLDLFIKDKISAERKASLLSYTLQTITLAILVMALAPPT